MDMGKAYPKVTAERAPQAVICWDPFHVIAMATRELDIVPRAHWNHLRDTADPATAKRFKGARWALLKRPEDLTDTQADTLAALRRAGGAPLARLPAQGSPPGDLRPRAALPRRQRAARPLGLLGATLPQASSPPSGSAWPTAVSRDSTTAFGSYPPRLRVPLRRRRHRARNALPRPHHAHSAAREVTK
jgi:hypothetical protein